MSPSREPSPNPMASLAELYASWHDTLSPMRESVAGYRVAMIAAGFSETAAEQMAVTYHAMVIAVMTKSFLAAVGE